MNLITYIILQLLGIAKYIAASGYGVYAVDHPGFGLSDGLHGYVRQFDDIVDNANEQFRKIKGVSKNYFSSQYLLFR